MPLKIYSHQTVELAHSSHNSWPTRQSQKPMKMEMKMEHWAIFFCLRLFAWIAVITAYSWKFKKGHTKKNKLAATPVKWARKAGNYSFVVRDFICIVLFRFARKSWHSVVLFIGTLTTNGVTVSFVACRNCTHCVWIFVHTNCSCENVYGGTLWPTMRFSRSPLLYLSVIHSKFETFDHTYKHKHHQNPIRIVPFYIHIYIDSRHTAKRLWLLTLLLWKWKCIARASKL